MHRTVTQSYYEGKTAALLRKYGPGPVVHYHIGLFDGLDTDTTVSELTLRRRIHRAQQALVERCAEVWEARETLCGNIIDLGCGFGGGSIYWAEHCGANVTAVTLAGGHIPLIERFTRESGVADRVHALSADAAHLPADLSFDSAVAMESMCYMMRDQVFACLRRVVRPGGWLCIQDVFLNRPQWRDRFDDYWKTRIAPVGEYLALAEQNGFHLDRNEDVTEGTTEFWIQSLAWNELRLSEITENTPEYTRLLQSIRWHACFLRAWRDSAIEVKLLRFRATGQKRPSTMVASHL